MDFAIFAKLKGDLRVRRFEGLTDLKRAFQKAFGTLSEDWFSQMYVKWVRRHDKYVTAKGEYFEKNVSVMTSFRSWCPARTMVYDLYVYLNIFYVYQLCKILPMICIHIFGNDDKKSATFYECVLVFKRLTRTF